MSGSVEKLEEYRINSGKTKTYLARKINVSRPRLDRIFSNPKTATWSQAERLGKELSIVKSDMGLIFLPDRLANR